jgi:hypothetical protein
MVACRRAEAPLPVRAQHERRERAATARTVTSGRRFAVTGLLDPHLQRVAPRIWHVRGVARVETGPCPARR